MAKKKVAVKPKSSSVEEVAATLEEQPEITARTPKAVVNIYGTKLVIDPIGAIDGMPYTISQAYTFEAGETKTVGEQITEIDALILDSFQVAKSSCCGADPTIKRLFQAIYD